VSCVFYKKTTWLPSSTAAALKRRKLQIS
jgi:hypothetical protein